MIFQKIYKYLLKSITENVTIPIDTYGQYIIIDEISNQSISYNNLNIIQNKEDDSNICCEIFKFS